MAAEYGKKLTDAQKRDLAAGFASVINGNCVENASNTPDYILGEYLVNCLEAFHEINLRREIWYGKKLQIGSGFDFPISSEPVSLEPSQSPSMES